MAKNIETTERTEIEEELLEVSKLKARDYPNRQDELAAILRAMEHVPNKEFDTISNGAANWYNAAADAMNAHEDLPDFDKFTDKSSDEDEEDTSDDHDHEGAEADSDAEDEDSDSGDDESDPDDEAETDPDEDQDEDEVNEGSVEEDEADEEAPPSKKAKKKAPAPAKGKREVDAADDSGADEVDDTKTPKKKSSSRISQEAQDIAAEAEEESKPKKPKLRRKSNADIKTPYDRLSGAKDKWGLYEGTQTSKAAALYEQGCTVKHVTDVLGGKHRNVLTKLAEFGHRVEKLPGGVYKVTHKDNAQDPKPKKAKKK